MPRVVCEPCNKCKAIACVQVCPVECFHEDEKMLVIDPNVCIDCGACQPECPVDAIYADDEVPKEWQAYVALNKEKSKTLPIIK